MRQTTPYLALLAGLLGHPLEVPAQNDIEFRWRSFAQLTAERVETSGDSIAFGADRVRTILEATRDQLTAGIMLDFGVRDLGQREPGALANVVGDLYLNYRPSENHTIRFGQFKTPLGMDFNIPGEDLDITKRGVEAGLVLNRDLGVMLSGRRLGSGFGYDVGLFNPAGRSGATAHQDSQVGQDTAPVVRAHYDTPRWHVEAAHGRSEHAGGPGTLDYRVSDVGMIFREDRWVVKGEWVEGRNIRGIDGWTERVYYLHGAYRLRPGLELLGRHYEGTNRLGGVSTRLKNTYLGLTAWVWEGSSMMGRLQVNYVIAGGDKAGYSGIRGFRDDAILVQFQLLVDR